MFGRRALDDITEAYLETGLWSTPSWDDDGSCLDAHYDVSDVTPEAWELAREHVASFLGMVSESDMCAYTRAFGYGNIGHDLWLTANGHGAGFWDRGLGDIGDRLSDASEGFGSDLYCGDDGRIYLA